MMLMLFFGCFAACAGPDGDEEIELGAVYDPAEAAEVLDEGQPDAAPPDASSAPSDALPPEELEAEQDLVEGDVGALLDTISVADDPALEGVDPALLAALDAAIDEASIRTAEEITSRGPLGGGFLGMSLPQWKALISLIFDVLISTIGVGLIRWLQLQYRERKAERAVAQTQERTVAQDLERLRGAHAAQRQVLQQEREARIGLSQELARLRAIQARAAERDQQPAPERPEPARHTPPGRFEAMGSSLLDGDA